MIVQQAYLGKDSIKEIAPLLKRHHAKQVFLVRGKSSYVACGAEKVVKNALTIANCEFTEFYDFSENPKCEDVEKGIELLKSSKADFIIAVGGGSVMDMAKLIRFFSSYKGDITGKSYVKKGSLYPLIAMPTTAGTGAETTHFAVVYKDKVKYSAEHDDMLPDYAIVYPPFTYRNSKYLTACTGFDALAQAIEAFWNLNATEESDIYAEKAISFLWPSLPNVVNMPTVELRDIVSEGSYWAGRAINITKTTAPHAVSYPFTSYYGYPHGHAVALIFPYFMALNCSEKNKDIARVCRLLDILGFDRNRNLMGQMAKYIETIGLQKREDTIIDKEFILSQVNLERLKNNPVGVLITEDKDFM